MATQPDPWAEFRGAPGPASPAAPRPIIPREPPPARPEEVQGDLLRNTRTQQEIAEGNRELEQAQIARQRARDNSVRNGQVVIGTIDRALERVGAGSTGIPGAITGRVPGTGAYNLRAELETIRANLGFDRLQQMRDASPTGGALGQVAIQELTALQSSLGNLDAGQSPDELRRNLVQIRQHYANWLAAVEGREPQAPGEATGQVLGAAIGQAAGQAEPATPGGTVRFLDEPTPPEGPSWTPEQQRLYDAFLQVNPNATPDQLRTFARAAGLGEIENAEDIIANREGGFQPGSAAQFRQADISDARGGDGGVNPLGMTGALGIGGEQIDAGIRGAADVLSLGMADEIAAAGDTIFGRGGTYGENLYRQREIDEYDTQNNFGSRLTGQLAGGAILPTGVGRAAFGGARNALATGASREAARAAARNAGARRLGTEGAAFGGLYGLGSSEGSFTDRLTSGGISALVGGGAGYGLGRGVGSIVSRYGRGGQGSRYADRVEASDAMRAANELGIDMLPADVGGPFTRRMTGGAAQLPFAAGPIMRRAENTVSQARSARDDIAQATGNVLDPEAAGETARRGAMTYRTESRDQVGRAYDRAAELADDARIDPANARAMLDRSIAELSESPMGAPPQLQTLRQQLQGDFTVAGLRNLRTSLRDEFGQQGLRGSDIERRAMQVVDALTDDIATGLTRQGRGEAAQAYRTADQLHRERVRMIDDVLGPIIGQRGEKSGEQVVGALQRAMRGDSRRAREFMGALPRAEQDDVRATLIGQLGRANPGQQNAEGTAFSLSTFLSNWSALQPSAREAVFGRAANRALGKLAEVANRSRQAQRFANTSGTAGASNVSEMTRGLSYLSGYGTLGATAIIENVTGRMLSNPVFARWLARTPETPAQARANIAMLGKIARTQPAISAEVLGLQRMLMPQVGRAAASPDEGPYEQQ